MNNAAVAIYDILSFEERKFLTKIRCLSLKKGYCWAGNDYFVKLFKVSERTIRNWLDKLKKLKYIIVKIIHGKKTQRHIMLCLNVDCCNEVTKVAGGLPVDCRCSVPGKPNDKSGKALKKSPKVLYKSFNKDLYINSVFPTEKHIVRAHARTSETKKYIAKKFDDKKRTPEGVLRVVEKNELSTLSLKHSSTLKAQGVSMHPEKGYIFNVPKSIDAKRVPEGTLNTVGNIIKVLNQEVSAHYKADAKETLGLIVPLLKIGYNFADFAKVIANKCRDWLGTPFAKYLRPKTLFRADHFEDYLTQSTKKSQGKNNYKKSTKEPINKFANFKQREWDFEKIEFLSQHDSVSEEDLRKFEERRQAQKAIERPKVENSRQNKFQNFARRKWDFAKIKYLNQLRDDEPYTEEGMAEYRKCYEAQEAARAKREAENPRPTRFHNFEQRKWDFALIEKLAQED